MSKPSDRLDFVDKVFELHNIYDDAQVEKMLNAIKWIDRNFDDLQKLRQHLVQFLPVGRIAELNDDSIKSLAVYRANHLNDQIQLLKSQKINNTPLKAIVQILKLNGQ